MSHGRGVASGITLAALFQTCLDTFDLIHTARNQERDVRNFGAEVEDRESETDHMGRGDGLDDSS